MWDIYDKNGRWLGIAEGMNEAEAVENAKIQGMTDAVSASPCEE